MVLSTSFCSPPAGQVAITREDFGDPSVVWWVARRDGRELWRHPWMGPKVHAPKSGVTAFASRDLFVVDRDGSILERLPLGTAFGPRTLILCDTYLIYDTGALALARYDPKIEGEDTFRWLYRKRRVCVYHISKKRHAWAASEIATGIPLGVINMSLITLAISNMRVCMKSGKMYEPDVVPQIVLNEYAISSRTLKRSASIRLPRRTAIDIYDSWLYFARLTDTTVHIRGNKISVDNFFGDSFSGRLD